MKKRVTNFNSKNILLFVMCFVVFTVGVSLVSANYGYVCANCADNQVLKATEKCGSFTENGEGFEMGDNICMNGKYFQAGVYDWEIKKDGEVVDKGVKRVDNTGKFCLTTETEDCGEYEMNFGGMVQSYSVICNEPPVCTSQTIVGGTIYQEVVEMGVEGADVWVTCNEETIQTTSGADGAYSVNFDCEVCDYGDAVTVHATKEGLSGDNSGAVDMTWQIPCGIQLDVGIVNVPLVPEFGAVVAVLTVMGALGAFFVVRRK